MARIFAPSTRWRSSPAAASPLFLPPADRGTLVSKLARSEASFARAEDTQSGDLYVFVLEDPKAKKIRGTCQVFGQVGVNQPFYSYHVSTLTQTSPELGK